MRTRTILRRRQAPQQLRSGQQAEQAGLRRDSTEGCHPAALSDKSEAVQMQYATSR